MSLDELFLNTYQRFDFVVDKALGCYIYSNGKKYLDMISGIGVNSLGHLDRDVVSGIRKQLSKHLHLSNLFWQEVQINFAKEFLKTIGGKYRIFLSNSGAEATECALKISKLPYQGKRKKTLCFVGAFHGRTYGALSATYKEEFKKPFEPLLEGFKFVPFGDIESVRSELASREYAMVLLEPIQGEGGVITPPKDFIKELRKVCDETDTILVVDEIQTGVGKTGKFWCYEWEEIKPDVLLSSKAIGGGIPLGVTAFSEKLADFVKPGMHASTFGGNPLACAAGQVVIRKIRNKKFLRSVVQKGEYLKKQIQNIGFDVQGRGLMIGIIVDSSGKTEPKSINEFFIKRGIVINSMRTYKGDTRIRILPPLSIQKKDLDFFLNVLEDFKKAL